MITVLNTALVQIFCLESIDENVQGLYLYYLLTSDENNIIKSSILVTGKKKGIIYQLY